ncbi:MAG: ThiF family adenylyltransferase [Peptococcaceae bacterium]|nr:ThiF family adenylyltransferase [Peptococcaceae bacterium]
MQVRYTRNIPALSERECALMCSKRVCVIGCGGIGGHLVDQLSRIGVGALRVVDGDVFEETNLNRQLLSDTTRLGKRKALVAAEHIASVNPEIDVEVYDVMLSADNASALLEGCDLVFDALDTIDARRVLVKACNETHLPLVYGAIRGWVAQAALILPGEPLVDILYPENAQLNDKSVLAFTPALCASLQTALGVKYLCQHTVQSGHLYYVDLYSMEAEKLPLL